MQSAIRESLTSYSGKLNQCEQAYKYTDRWSMYASHDLVDSVDTRTHVPFA